MSQSSKEFEKRQQLVGMTVEELRKMCKENGISYYEGGKRLAKGPMIDKIMESTKEVATNAGEEIIKKSVKTNDKAGKKVEQPVKTAEELAAEEERRKENKLKYIENAKVGTIVAFKTETGKTISAMILKKSTKRRKFKLVTKYGAEFIIGWDEVIWVRTNKRWPKGVYLLFQKNLKKKAEEAEKDGSEEIS